MVEMVPATPPKDVVDRLASDVQAMAKSVHVNVVKVYGEVNRTQSVDRD